MGRVLKAVVAGVLILIAALFVSMMLASAIGLGPAEFWIIPAVLLAVIALVGWRYRTKQRMSLTGPNPPK